ncbi:MAG: porin family protein [Methylobacillus sp.]|nr:porin family protein [Methylobacillus sp.]
MPVASALLAFSLVTPATAADVGDWTGWHVGGNIGYGWGDADSRTIVLRNGIPYVAPDDLAPFKQSLDVNGALAGVQLGYDWQLGAGRNFVLGVEADINWSDMQDSDRKSPLYNYDGSFAGNPDSKQTVSADLDWLSTVRLRAGFLPQPNWLIYATGGLAIGKVKYRTDTDGQNGNPEAHYVDSSSKTATGWTLGGGTEYRFTSQWSVKAEYLYFDLGGNKKITADRMENPDEFQIRTRFDDLDGHILRVGVNYHF